MGRVLGDLAALEELAAALGAGREALEGLEAVVDLDATTAGDHGVAAALAGVADDWERRRQRLSSALATLEAYADAAAQAFVAVDGTVVTVRVPGRG
ncbi:MAG TPA: hypothetical protein VGR26_09075 [Acidimicrobiales bacterium]|nr:hypothetical protein [Acidimicrobiales bacterium]